MISIKWIVLLNVMTTTAILAKSCFEAKTSHEDICRHHDRPSQCLKYRMKRFSSSCVYDAQCKQCDCTFCQYSVCPGKCDSCCHSCCNNFVLCQNVHCCQKQCSYECDTTSCRSDCRRACYNSIDMKPDVIYPPTNLVQTTESKKNITEKTAHNVTTIINLHNVINNTNFLDIPINMNYTNKHNVSLIEQKQASSRDSCCVVISPRQCIPIKAHPYVRCFHTRTRQCGNFCTTNIVHQEKREVCMNLNSYGMPVDCHQQLTYVPQPKPHCVNTLNWPYVSCGIMPPNTGCESCFEHQHFKNYNRCPPICYQNFNTGPTYSQNPLFHIPYIQQSMHPCALFPQSCGSMPLGYGVNPLQGVEFNPPSGTTVAPEQDSKETETPPSE